MRNHGVLLMMNVRVAPLGAELAAPLGVELDADCSQKASNAEANFGCQWVKFKQYNNTTELLWCIAFELVWLAAKLLGACAFS